MGIRRWLVCVPRVRRVVVAGESMTPRLRPGDCLLVGVGLAVRSGDVVIARRPPSDPRETEALLLVKRAVRRVGGGWWLGSDNADLGRDDSRMFGPVPDALVVGRVLFRYYRPRASRPRG